MTHMALWVGEVELSAGLSPQPVMPASGSSGSSARILVRLHGAPLGFVTVPSIGWHIAPEVLAAEVERVLGVELHAHLLADGIEQTCGPAEAGFGGWERCSMLGASGWTEPISVIVCTRDRPDQLVSCLEALGALEHPVVEFLIVDNAPSDDRTRLAVEYARDRDPRFRYALEPTPGLSHARNLGVAEAKHDYLAFTDDDVIVDRRWLAGIARGFGRDRLVGCVTGLVPAASLDTASQRYFDQRCSWSNSFTARIYDLALRPGDNALYPYSPGVFGTGANFALDRRVIRELGGFDTALGAGSPAGGGEDLDIFIRVLQSKRALAFEPSAIVWHVHRGRDEELKEQMYDYGRGLAALIAKHLLDPRTAFEVIRRVPGGLARLATLWTWSEPDGQARAPRAGYIGAEARGMLAGPSAYRRGRRLDRRTGGHRSR
jgi:GT2 family glycosyltransferase